MKENTEQLPVFASHFPGEQWSFREPEEMPLNGLEILSRRSLKHAWRPVAMLYMEEPGAPEVRAEGERLACLRNHARICLGTNTPEFLQALRDLAENALTSREVEETFTIAGIQRFRTLAEDSQALAVAKPDLGNTLTRGRRVVFPADTFAERLDLPLSTGMRSQGGGRSRPVAELTLPAFTLREGSCTMLYGSSPDSLGHDHTRELVNAFGLGAERMWRAMKLAHLDDYVQGSGSPTKLFDHRPDVSPVEKQSEKVFHLARSEIWMFSGEDAWSICSDLAQREFSEHTRSVPPPTTPHPPGPSRERAG